MTFGEKLIQLRREKGYSQEQLADLLDVTRQSVSKWEAGSSMPEIAKLVVLADLFQVSLDYLLREGQERELPLSKAPTPLSAAAPKAEAAHTPLDSGREEILEQLQEIRKTIRRSDCYEFKSRARIFGIPLVHVKFARNNRMAVARGIIAIGQVAVGVVSVGGIAAGLVSVGGLSLGLLFALGGVALGGFAFGGVAVGLLAVGGVAIGVLAKGGVALASELASGGVASARVAVGKTVSGEELLSIPSSSSGLRVPREEIRQFIRQNCPGLWEWVVRLFAIVE